MEGITGCLVLAVTIARELPVYNDMIVTNCSDYVTSNPLTQLFEDLIHNHELLGIVAVTIILIPSFFNPSDVL